MEPIWLPQYPKGVPAQIAGTRWQHLSELFETSCQQYHDQIAFTHLNTSLSFAQLAELGTHLASYLQHQHTLKPGQRLAIMLPNCLQYPVSLYAAFKVGLTVVNINPLYTLRECKNQLMDAQVHAIIVLKQYAHLIADVLANSQLNIPCVIITELADLFGPGRREYYNLLIRTFRKNVPNYELDHAVSLNEALTAGQQNTLIPVSVKSEDIALLQYTGGTTGVAKGAMLSHGNLLANIAQVSHWIQSCLTPGHEIILTAIPLYHIFAFMANCLTFLSLGAQNILISDPRHLTHLIKTMKQHPITCITGVNSLFNTLLHHPKFNKEATAHIKMCLAGGMAVQTSVAERWQQFTGHPILQAYGLTETSPAVSLNPPNLKHFNGSIGLPIPSTQISIRDEKGIEVQQGEPGELFVKGPQVMQGYWRQPQETAQVLDQAGWFATGDMVKIECNGFLYLLERKKEMICVSGFNVYPNEIEELLTRHDGVQEAAVIGVDDPHSGQRVKAFVVKKLPDLDKETLFTYCKSNLTNYKRPKFIEFIDELPKSTVGKVLRKDLQ